MIAPDLREYVQMIRSGKAGIVRERLEAVVAADPTHVAVHAVLAMAHDAEGGVEEAVLAWRRAHLFIPESHAVTEGLRRALRRRLIARVDARLVETASLLSGLPVDQPDETTAEPSDPEPAKGLTLEDLASALEAEPPEAETPATESLALEVQAPEPPAPEPLAPEALQPDTLVDEAGPDDDAVDALAAELAAEIAPPAVEEVAEPAADVAVQERVAPEEPIEIEEPVAGASTATRPEAGRAPGREAEGLDDLIRELESARIVPDPTVKPVEPSDIEPDVDDIVSETLARIYSNQRFFEEAARVYDKLAVQQPARAEEFRQKAAEIRGRSPR